MICRSECSAGRRSRMTCSAPPMPASGFLTSWATIAAISPRRASVACSRKAACASRCSDTSRSTAADSDDLPEVVLDGRERERHVELGAVALEAPRLDVRDVLPALDALEQISEFVFPIRRKDSTDGLAEDLVALPAVDSLRARVPRGDHAVERFSDDRVVRVLDDRRRAPELLLGPLPVRDVGANGQVLVGLPVVAEERHDRRVDPVDAPVLGPVADLASPDASARDRLPELPDELLRVVAGVDDAVVLPEQLLAGVLRDLAELVVDVVDDPALVRPRDDRGLVEGVDDVVELAASRPPRPSSPAGYGTFRCVAKTEV